jgi:hypothetical protein
MPKVIADNIADAEIIFGDLKKPTKTQIRFKQQLDTIKETVMRD